LREGKGRGGEFYEGGKEAGSGFKRDVLTLKGGREKSARGE